MPASKATLSDLFTVTMPRFTLKALLVFLFATIGLAFSSLSQADEAYSYLRLDAYQTSGGLLETFSHGEVADPYFGLYSLTLASRYGMHTRAVARRFIDWGLQAQRPNGQFFRYCRQRQGWVACGDTDSDDATLARWVELLYAQAQGQLPPSWQHSAQLALQALARQKMRNGVYSVFPPNKPGYAGYALFKDNVEVYSAFRAIASTLRHSGHNAQAQKFSLRAERLHAAMARAFGDRPFALKALALGAHYDHPMFYPQAVAAPFGWLEGYFPKPTPSQWSHWLSLYESQWIANAKTDYPWGILALQALSAGDRGTAGCWLLRYTPDRLSNAHWNILEETSAQILEKQEPRLTCPTSSLMSPM